MPSWAASTDKIPLESLASLKTSRTVPPTPVADGGAKVAKAKLAAAKEMLMLSKLEIQRRYVKLFGTRRRTNRTGLLKGNRLWN